MSRRVAASNPPFVATLDQLAVEQPLVARGDALAEKNCANDFVPIRILGRGSTGTVLLALHRKSQKVFAIKAMSKPSTPRPRSLERAQTEMDVLARLDHPFLSTLHSHFESPGYSFLVLNFCSGGDLNAVRHRQLERKFSEAAIRFYGAELILALEHLHDLGYVYRDLKPENVLLSDSGHVILTDFDLCRKQSRLMRIPVELDVHQTVEPKNYKPSFLFSCFCKNIALDDIAEVAYCMSVNGGESYREGVPGPGKLARSQDQGNGSTVTKIVKHFVGTEEYVAPELLSGEEYDFTVDWWSFGVLLYELVYGKTPFKGTYRKNTFFNILHKEPQYLGPWNPLQDLIRKLLIKDPKRRLGYYDGAMEVKAHAFFKGVQWDNLQHVARPPIVPAPISAEKIWGRKGNQLSSDLETYLATVEIRRRKHSMAASSYDESEQSSEGESDDKSSSTEPCSRSVSDK